MSLTRTAFALLALSLAQAAAACSRELRVGISELGYGVYLNDGQWQGIVPDLVAELSQRSGCQLRLVSRPRARLLMEFDQGQLDIVTTAVRTAERDRVGWFLPYSYAVQDLIVVGDPIPLSLEELRRLPDARLGLVRGVRLGRRLNEQVSAMLTSHQAEYSPDFDNLAARLAAGRLKAALIPNVIYAKLKDDRKLPARVTTVRLAESQLEPLGLYVNRRHVSEEDLQQVAHHLEALKHDGRMVAAYLRHVGEIETRRLSPKGAGR